MNTTTMRAEIYHVFLEIILPGLKRYTWGSGLGLMAMTATCLAEIPDVLFSIGTEDQNPAEFLLGSGAGWKQYEKTVHAPVRFIVGTSQPQKDWPYIHPSVRDTWAGNKTHPFTIQFFLDERPAKPLTLIIGQIDALAAPLLSVSVNGRMLGAMPAPPGTGNSSGLAETVPNPQRTLFAIQPDRLAIGTNEIAITVERTSWIIYDFVMLCSKVPPVPSQPTVADRVDALKNGDYGPLDEIVFATRSQANDGHWYANFSYWSTPYKKINYGKDGRLCCWNLKTGIFRLLVDDTDGAVRDPCVSYDATKILFSYRKGGEENFHLFEIDVDGQNMRQLTEGIFDDFEPSYLPDGDIIFVSSRGRRWVNCWLTQVATIYRCRVDGSDIRPLSANIEQDNTPWPLPDGRILYMRWEYVDRSQVNYHHLWTMNPDGTQHSIFFGNMHPGGLYIDARPIPDSTDVLFIDSPGHGRIEHKGFLARVSQKEGPDMQQNLKRITRSGDYRDPWAFSSDLFMAANERNVMLVNNKGIETLLFSLPRHFENCLVHEPRPVQPRKKESLIADKTDWNQPDGLFFLENIYEGRLMTGVEKGSIKKLMVLESLPKPINFTGGMDPLSYVGTFSLPRVLGTVPVESDGSAYFAAPALRALFFVALDDKGRAVKRMQSFTQLMPGEQQGCTGCHEPRTQAPRIYSSKSGSSAIRRKPSQIDAKDRMFDVPDFTRHIQPVLDRNCIRCHNSDDRKGGVDLCGDRGPMFSIGYHSLAVNKQIADGRNYAKSNYAPYTLGSGGSPLMKKLDGSHHGVKPSPQDVATIALWLDASAPYPGTYAALGCGSIGGYIHNNQSLHNDKDWPTTQKAGDAFNRRCAECHHASKKPLPRYLSDENGLSFWSPSMDDPRLKSSRHALFNLTHPEKSYFLKAPLAKEAGGFGRCMTATNTPVFVSVNDPDYLVLIKMIEAGKDKLNEIKRFDMPGFRPRMEYLSEMKRYGLLPPTFDAEKDNVDPYEMDRRYWDSFIYQAPQ